jgi:competence protein ComFC
MSCHLCQNNSNNKLSLLQTFNVIRNQKKNYVQHAN